LDGDSRPPGAYGVIASNASATVVCNEAAYPAYVVNATTVKRMFTSKEDITVTDLK